MDLISGARNISHLWAGLVVEELVRSGVDQFVLSPGSRSTPLVVALAENDRTRKLVHFDERATAFHALGLARATGRPAAWITTSGTAVANGYPAVVEAAQDCVPLLLVTADRPPELRSAGANQTIDQQKIFGEYIRWYFDLPAADASLDPRMVLSTIDQAVHRAMAVPAGPVHLNCMFREPLSPHNVPFERAAIDASLVGWSSSCEPHTRYHRPRRTPSPESVEQLGHVLQDVQYGVLVLGRMPAGADVRPVRKLIDALRWPVLADVTSPLRFDPVAAQYVVPHHLLFASDVGHERFRPQVVIQIGPEPVSRRLSAFLREVEPSLRVLVHDGPARHDSDHRGGIRFDCDVAAFCAQLVLRMADDQRANGAWAVPSDVARGVVETVLDEDGTDVSEPWVAWMLPRRLPAGSGLFLGNSMPVRDVDAFGFGESSLRVAGNRGASGIDGTLSTAIGYCAGCERVTAVLLGDLALLHDFNALAMARTLRHPFPIIVINNDGGGIFSFLEISGFPAFFEDYFGTPHGLVFEHGAAMFHIPYAAPESRAHFEAVLEEAIDRSGPTLIEVRTERSANLDLHRRIDERLADRLRTL